jgi:translin
MNLNHEDVRAICAKIRQNFDLKDRARERALAISREVIRNSANAIRAIHREEFEPAKKLLEETGRLVKEMNEALRDCLDVYHAGFVQDAQKEYAEGLLTLAMVRKTPLPDPDDIGVDYGPYLGALAEAVGELRRHILDHMRRRDSAWGEEMLDMMDEVYYQLVSFDYPNAVSGGLKRISDMLRSVLERTRGDLTTAIRQQELEQALSRLEQRLPKKP